MKALALTLIVAISSGSASSDEILIIANPSTPVTALSSDELAKIYLLKTVSWTDGTRIVPVNRESASDTRARFNSSILKEDNAELSAYWNQMHFKGKVPPVIQESDQAMVAFVQKVPGAIGYVFASSSPSNVKIIGRIP